MSKIAEMTGKRFGRLVVSGRSGSTNGRAVWACICDCGENVSVLGKSLRAGLTTSCGCAQRDAVIRRNKTHGQHGTKEYRVWKHIKGRCFCITDAAYQNYGGRGIGMWPAWVDDFEAFLAGVGLCPSPDLTLDRIDNSRGYEPGNTRWAKRRVQNRNTRRNILVRVGENEMVLKDACSKLGLNYGTVADRVRRGYSAEDALYGRRSGITAGGSQG